MNNWEELGKRFIKQKQYLGYKYRTSSIVVMEITTYLTNEKIEIITKEVTEKYARINSNLRSNTIARNMGVFREFCKYLKTQNINSYQIPPKIYPQKHKDYIPYIYSKNEIKKLIEASIEVSKALPYSYRRHQTLPIIFKILYQTGMRIGEVLELKVKDYLETEECFYLKNTKNDQERLIYLSKSLNEEILNYHSKFHYNNNLDDYFFKITESKIGMTTIQKTFNKMLKAININKTNKHRVHNLRHCFIIHYLEKILLEGKDVNVILPILQVHLGHQSLKALEHYFRITQIMINEIGKISEQKLGMLIPSLKGIDEDDE